MKKENTYLKEDKKKKTTLQKQRNSQLKKMIKQVKSIRIKALKLLCEYIDP